ncbi:MAG: glutamine--tRNA ligase/YqeY domain fusion protein [Anaerolineaceae bacterium]|nr:glutamine--tRNA ligase/YqeY domain fusion protein [Anaerolineaceae bacterium]
MTDKANPEPTNFIRDIIDSDMESRTYGGRVQTRFPPEPNGYLHIGHAKSIHLNFGIAKDYQGSYFLRFDDTNPLKEEQKYIDSIQEDIKWLGYEIGDNLCFASDYFDQLYELAIKLIKDGNAYIDDLSAEEIKEYRGTLTSPGKNSPFRDRPIEENLKLFEQMKDGEFPEGSKVLRIKVDMTSGNMNMRDPILYRILHAAHPRTGDKWCIYPMYDWAHGQCDALEGTTHSICTLEFESHRPLYEHFLKVLEFESHPKQIEFARLNLSYTVMSKRRLLRLVNEGYISDWDDPRAPTLSGLRRRGFTPESIANFCETIGVAKTNSVIDYALLEYVLRQDLESRAQRAMAVLDPIRVIIDNYPEDQVENFEVPRYPQDKENFESRVVPFSREIFIDRDDFMEEPARKYFRLSPGREVRLLNAYYITCVNIEKDSEGNITCIHCTYDPETRGGMSPDGRRVKGTIHWVSAQHAVDAELRLYEHLFTKPNPYDVDEGQDFMSNLNPNSLTILKNCKLEPSLADSTSDLPYQFMRKGYFIKDKKDSIDEKLVFNRTVSLRDSWAKKQKK